jgi:hypothetical protein
VGESGIRKLCTFLTKARWRRCHSPTVSQKVRPPACAVEEEEVGPEDAEVVLEGSGGVGRADPGLKVSTMFGSGCPSLCHWFNHRKHVR